MDITAIRIKDGLCEIGYTTADGQKGQRILDKRNPPHAAFVDAMRQAMGPLAAQILGLPAGESDRLALRSVTFKPTEDRHGDQTVAVKLSVSMGGIAGSEKPATISLPTLWTETTRKGVAMADEMREALDFVTCEAAAYVSALDAKAE